MKHSEINEYAQKDLKRVLKWVKTAKQQTDAVKELQAKMQDDAPSLEEAIWAALQSVDFAKAPAYETRLTSYLKSYAESALNNGGEPAEEYRRAVAVRRSRQNKQRIPDGYVADVNYAWLRNDVVKWWAEFTPEERGAHINALYDQMQNPPE